MSYIHDALKKAQREKDSLVTKYSNVWSSVRSPHRLFKRSWLVSTCLIVISVVLSSYSWLHSLPELSLHQQENVATRRAIAQRPEQPVSSKVGKSHLDQSTMNFQGLRGPGEATKKRPLPADEKQTKPTQEGQQPLVRTPGPDQGTTLYSRALALQKEGRLQDAKRFYERALERSPRLASALNNLGAIHIREKNYDTARRMLEKAIRMEPGYVDPYYNLACLYALQKDVGRSLAYLKKATSVNAAVRQWARSDEDLQNLRGHSEYEKIIQGVRKS
jgi:tetratricopeptide (TPR) repeat protein